MSSTVSIPCRPEHVTSDWLAAVLSKAGTVEVRDVTVTEVGTGQTGATYRVRADYSSNPTGLPETFVIKIQAQDETVRDRVTLGYRSECAFYASVADRVKIPVPQCFHCEITADAMDYALLLADQAPAVQGDQISGCGDDQARIAVTALAGLHAPTWCQSEWLTFPGLAMTTVDEVGAQGMGDVARMSADMTIDKLGSEIDTQDRETLTTAMDLVADWVLNDFGRFSLIHGDYRLDNMLFHPQGGVTVVDWQTLGVGLPARDLAYFAATSLDPKLRRQIERDLVDQYHRALGVLGVEGYSLDDCWQDYRFGIIQAPLISALGCAFAVGTDRGDAMMAVMLRRGCQAIRDLDTVALVRELTSAQPAF